MFRVAVEFNHYILSMYCMHRYKNSVYQVQLPQKVCFAVMTFNLIMYYREKSIVFPTCPSLPPFPTTHEENISIYSTHA